MRSGPALAMPKLYLLLTIYSAHNKFLMPQAAAAAAEIPKPAAIKMRLTCDNDLYFGSFYGTNSPPRPARLAPALPVLCFFLLLLLLMLPAPACLLLPPLSSPAAFLKAASLCLSALQIAKSHQIIQLAVCAARFGADRQVRLAWPVLASSSRTPFLLLLLILFLLLLLLLLLHAGINIAAFIYAVYICTLPSPTSCNLFPTPSPSLSPPSSCPTPPHCAQPAIRSINTTPRLVLGGRKCMV